MHEFGILVAHGSPNQGYRQAFNTLVTQVACQVPFPIHGAFLECAGSDLCTQISNIIHDYPDDCGALRINILPLFLLSGVHVREDLPKAIAQLQTCFPQVHFNVLDYFGQSAQLAASLGQLFERAPQAQRILIAHGSRRAGANSDIVILAQHLQAIPCYWVTEPTLEATIAQIDRQSRLEVHVLPFFLLPGKITKAIAAQIEDLGKHHGQLRCQLLPPLASHPACIQAIAVEFLAR